MTPVSFTFTFTSLLALAALAIFAGVEEAQAQMGELQAPDPRKPCGVWYKSVTSLGDPAFTQYLKAIGLRDMPISMMTMESHYMLIWYKRNDTHIQFHYEAGEYGPGDILVPLGEERRLPILGGDGANQTVTVGEDGTVTRAMKVLYLSTLDKVVTETTQVATIPDRWRLKLTLKAKDVECVIKFRVMNFLDEIV